MYNRRPLQNKLLNFCQQVNNQNIELTEQKQRLEEENYYLKKYIKNSHNQLNSGNFDRDDNDDFGGYGQDQEWDVDQNGNDDENKITLEDIREFVNNNGNQSFVIFYGQRCGHCHDLFRKLGFDVTEGKSFIVPEFNDVLPANVLAIEGGDVSERLVEKMGINGFPDVRLFEFGREKRFPQPGQPGEFKDLRESLIKYVDNLRNYARNQQRQVANYYRNNL
jgi:thiol-disulfide isomerase/thioredoxin